MGVLRRGAMRRNILISLIIICLVVISTMPFYHIFYDVPVLIQKERLTLADTFMSTRAHWENYENASPEEQVEISQTRIHQILFERGYLPKTTITVTW